MDAAFDTVVVGAGSAGAALAARLSEDPAHHVLLVEAGPDLGPRNQLPAAILDARSATTDYDWGYQSEPDHAGRSIPLPRAKLVGGCSATNAVFALRGSPSDYDQWAGLGNDGWSFAGVLPFFRGLETDLDFDDEWHGHDGPIAIQRVPVDGLREHQRAALEAAWALGHPPVVDHNRPGAVGAGPLPRNAPGDERLSTALAYLAPAGTRPNLTVRADTLVDRVLLAGTRAQGVLLANGEQITADHVVLAAGAYGSPTILMRSGIGPARHLAALGIGVAADLSGVGTALVDHPMLSVIVPTLPSSDGRWFEAAITWRSTLAGDDPYDMHTIPGGPITVTPDESPTGNILFLFSSVMRPRSRGRVTLRSTNPVDPPRIRTGGLNHPDDLARMIEAVQHTRELFRTGPLRELVCGDELTPGPAAQAHDELAAAVQANTTVYHHACGTCPMGPDPDAGAVVDPTGRVHGIDGLVVADASIMPAIPAANTNLPTIVLAERIAHLLRSA